MSHSNSSRLRLAAIAALVFAFAAASLAKTHSDSRFENIKIKNFGQMDDRFYRGAKPKERDIADLKALGIRTVIDLTDDSTDEKVYVEAQGLQYVNIAIPDKHNPSDEQITQFLKLVNDPATGKFYVHCAGGRHRTGVMGAIYRFNVYHWNLDQAYKEMLDFDFYTSWGHGGQKTFVENYAQRFQDARRDNCGNESQVRDTDSSYRSQSVTASFESCREVIMNIATRENRDASFTRHFFTIPLPRGSIILPRN